MTSNVSKVSLYECWVFDRVLVMENIYCTNNLEIDYAISANRDKDSAQEY